MVRLRGRGFFVVAAAIWATVVIVLPSAQPTGPASVAASSSAPGGTSAIGGSGAASPNAAAALATGVAPGVTGGPSRGGAAIVGRSRTGVVCVPGALQIPDSGWSPPCVPAFTGDNGGATANGVTATTIRIANRYFGPSVESPTGDTPSADAKAVFATFLTYLNATTELYGRRVVVEDYQSPHGDPLAEATGQGRDAACEDAIALSQEHHDFGVLYSASPVFEDCAAQHGLLVADAEGRPMESFLQAHDPYLWTYEQECDRIAYGMVEYAGKRLLHRPATWAGEADFQTRTRKFGVLIPDSAYLQPCLALFKQEMARQYGAFDVVEFDYQPDPSSLSDQMARAAIKFKAAGVTTLVMASDPASFQFLTQSAHNQNYFPEWINIGVAGDDTDDAGQSYDQTEVDGHMFGRSEYLADAAYSGPGSEADTLYRKLTGKPLPPGIFDGDLGTLLNLFRLLEMAGPNLSASAVAAGVRRTPILRDPQGVLSYLFNPDGSPGFSHASMLDANEIWWDGAILGANGKRGGFRVNPRRYLPGQWPTTPPDIYPERP